MKPKQLCVLCGVNEATKGDGDHLPPQSLYPKPRAPNVALNKVPACIECNGAGSKDDEVFKLIIGMTTGEFRENQDDLINSLARTFDGNRRLARQIFSSAKHVYAKRHGGILEPVVAIPFDPETYHRVVKRIVTGLHWQQTGTILRDAKIQVIPGDAPQGTLLASIRAWLLIVDPVVLNGGTFTYKVAYDEEGGSFWGLQFFGKHTVFAMVDSSQVSSSKDTAPDSVAGKGEDSPSEAPA